MSSRTIYLKAKQIVSMKKQKVILKDIAEVWCLDKNVKKTCESILVYSFPSNRRSRKVTDILEIIQKIQELYPDYVIANLGEKDIILDLDCSKPEKSLVQIAKTILICLVIFFGAAFAILAFNYDAGVTQIMKNVYEKLTGAPRNQITILEIMYSIGLFVGIMVFYNHIKPQKTDLDPTPLDIEMVIYEKNVDTTVISNNDQKQRNQ